MRTRLTTEGKVWLGILAAGAMFWWGMFRVVEWAVFGGWHL